MWDDAIANVKNVASKGNLANEFSLARSNRRGTIAMAKLGGDPDSATSQWYINLADNGANLDFQNGGFTVFGEVSAASMAVVDAIAALPRINAGSPFDSLPVVGTIGGVVSKSNLVLVTKEVAVAGQWQGLWWNASESCRRVRQRRIARRGGSGLSGRGLSGGRGVQTRRLRGCGRSRRRRFRLCRSFRGRT